MRIVVSGGTGFVGRRLVERLLGTGHVVGLLTRDPERARAAHPRCEVEAFPGPSGGLDAGFLSGADAVVHLAGENVAGRWTRRKREAIESSRIGGTRTLVAALAACERRPPVLVSASAIGYYGDRGEEELTEDSGPSEDFLSRVCQSWEAAAREATAHGVRVVTPRIGIVLGRGGGALGSMEMPFRLGLGGPLGSGAQWWSWILLDDLVSMLVAAVEGLFDGPVNAVAPGAVRQREFARTLGRRLGRPAILPAPAVALRLAVGGFSYELLSSKRVLPRAAERAGFAFEAPDLMTALERLYG